MQEALDRRALDHRVVGGDEQRLAQLAVPVAEVQAVALEAVDGDLLAAEVGDELVEGRVLGAHHRLHHRLHRDPRRPVGAAHVALGLLLEAAGELRRTVARPGPVPGFGDQALGAHHRTRAHGVVGHAARKLAVAVGDEDDVVVGARGQQADVAELALARVVAEHEVLLRHDLQAQPARGVLEGGADELVVVERPLQQQHVAPLLEHQELRDRVGLHAVVGQRVIQVGLALRLAQRVVRRRDVEQQQLASAGGSGDFGHHLTGRVDQEVAHALGVQLVEFGHQRRRVGAARAHQVEAHPERLADEARLAQRHLGAGEGRPVRPRQGTEEGLALVVTRVLVQLEVAEADDLGRPGDQREQQQ